MAVKSVKSFRIAPIGGFNRQDVMEFISSAARERQEEAEAYRAGAEKLRGERDKLSSQVEALSGFKEQAELLAPQNEILLQEKEALRTELFRLQSEHASLREEADVLRSRVKQYEAELGGFGDIKSKLADMEMQAYRRAEAIETEASQNAAKARAALTHALTELGGRYKSVMADSEAAAYTVVREMDKMRDWFAHFLDIFEGVGAQIQAMSQENRPVVRDFIPEEFEEE